MKLVLDDQVRRTDRADGLDLGRTKSLTGLVVAIAVCPLPQQAVPLALLAHATKQRPHLTAPRHHGELVHGGDHHCWRAVVDLFVHRQHRDAGVH
ncbi:hypothetical protein FQZ97_1003680 [compost metagenome]